jgi:16S rRNA (uracil1498-N3)-methyltransferase
LNLYYQPKLTQGLLQLDETESQHVIKVLRHQPGDAIPVTDGLGSLYFCEISSIEKKTCSLTIQRVEKKQKPVHHIHIAIAPTKSSDRTEWFVEKATEIGVQKISFIQTQHSERQKINLERIEKVAVSAIKQSGQVWLPEITGLVDFKTILQTPADQKFIAHVDGNTKHLKALAAPGKSYLVLIGPEGDFSDMEIAEAVKAGFQSVSLGINTLRTETAGVVTCSTLNLVNS